jgi:hypothetical protein
MYRSLYNDPNMPEEYKVLGKFGGLLWLSEKQQHILTEGLITSYPVSNILSMLNRKYKDSITHIQSDPFIQNLKDIKTSGISLYINKKNFNEELLNKIKKDIDVYGYFVAFVQKYNIFEIGIFIEPKFPYILDKKYLKKRKLYHITNIKNLNKIKKIGLTPKESQTSFNHPENRIYLMASFNKEFINNFKITLSKNKNWQIQDIITLEINPDNLELYIDPNFDNDILKDVAVFTFQNIHPSKIKII